MTAVDIAALIVLAAAALLIVAAMTPPWNRSTTSAAKRYEVLPDIDPPQFDAAARCRSISTIDSAAGPLQRCSLPADHPLPHFNNDTRQEWRVSAGETET